MRTQALIVVMCVVCYVAPPRLMAADPSVKVIVHPARAARMEAAEVRAIYLKQKQLWPDNQAIIAINHEVGNPAREWFSERVLGQGSRRLAAYWNQRYFEAGEFPPATLASDEAVLRFIAGNQNAIGYVTVETLPESVAVVLVLP